MQTTVGLLFLTACTLLACSSTSSTSAPTSTVEGKVDGATFALAVPTGLDAVDEAGARTHLALATDGAFRLVLAKGHSYRLLALTSKGEEPLVFPRPNGHLDRTFRVSSGAALVALGTIRHFDRAPSTFSVTNDATTSCEGGREGASQHSDGECENGKDQKTGAACTDLEDTEVADPAQPMAVPERNPPTDVAGCEDGTDDGETDD